MEMLISQVQTACISSFALDLHFYWFLDVSFSDFSLGWIHNTKAQPQKACEDQR